MITILRSIPAVLAALLIAAHFMRAGSPIFVLVAVLLIPLAFVRRPGAALVVRLGLAAATVEWLLTAWELAGQRAAAGAGSGRLLVILGAVAAFTALAAWLLPSPSSPGEQTASPGE